MVVVLRSSSQPSILNFVTRWTYRSDYLGFYQHRDFQRVSDWAVSGERGIFPATVFQNPCCTKSQPKFPSKYCRLYTTIAMDASRLARRLEYGNLGIQTTTNFPRETPREAFG